MLLFDESKALEEALGVKATAVLAKVMERQDKESKEDLATKADLLLVKSELQREIAELRGEMNSKIDRAKVEILRWMIALVVGQIGAIAVIIRIMVK